MKALMSFLLLQALSCHAEYRIFQPASVSCKMAFQSLRIGLHTYEPKTSFATELLQNQAFSEINRQNDIFIEALSEFLPESLLFKISVFQSVSIKQQDYFLWLMNEQIYKVQPLIRTKISSLVDLVRVSGIAAEDLPSIIKQTDSLYFLGPDIRYYSRLLRSMHEAQILKKAKEESLKLERD